jgi:hypothetical protein
MNIFGLNCKTLTNEDVINTPLKLAEANYKEFPVTQDLKPVVIRKRRLFNHDNMEDDLKENLYESVQNVTKKSKLDKSLNKASDGCKTPAIVKVKRRETMAYFKPRDTSIKARTPVKPVVSPKKFIVCTNMSSNDKGIMNAVSFKLFIV